MSFSNSCRESVVISGLRFQHGLRLTSTTLVGRALDAQARRSGWVDFLDQLDVTAFEDACNSSTSAWSRPSSAVAVSISAYVSTPSRWPRVTRPLTSFKLLKLRY